MKVGIVGDPISKGVGVVFELTEDEFREFIERAPKKEVMVLKRALVGKGTGKQVIRVTLKALRRIM